MKSERFNCFSIFNTDVNWRNPISNTLKNVLYFYIDIFYQRSMYKYISFLKSLFLAERCFLLLFTFCLWAFPSPGCLCPWLPWWKFCLNLGVFIKYMTSRANYKLEVQWKYLSDDCHHLLMVSQMVYFATGVPHVTIARDFFSSGSF